jgi:hypothetical protein
MAAVGTPFVPCSMEGQPITLTLACFAEGPLDQVGVPDPLVVLGGKAQERVTARR